MTALPAGVELIELTAHGDHRGRFAELYREEWKPGVTPLQWNLMASVSGSIRGMHVHPRHDDYLVQVAGRCDVGLKDLREGSPTEDLAVVVPLDGDAPQALVIPHGVAHALLFRTDSIQVLGVSHYWDTDDELGCRFDDPDLGLDWDTGEPLISPRDETLPSLAGLRAELARHQPIV